MKDVVPTKEQQIALATEAKKRMEARARSWLEDRTVKEALQRFDPSEMCRIATLDGLSWISLCRADPDAGDHLTPVLRALSTDAPASA